ncbi:MAG: dTMP kinase [Erysipelotrichaceae bacterium]
MNKGYFITFEGNDGCGKTTISKLVYDKLIELGYDVILTREPGGIDIAEQIRDVILKPENTAMDAKTEALLYAASRRQHLVEKVLPALEKNKIVLCDRFIDSSLAYQGVGRNLGIKEVLKMNEFAIEGNMPIATIFLKLSPEQGLARIASRQFKDRLDIESINFHHLVAKGYEEVVEMFQDRMQVVDASLELNQVYESALAAVLKVIANV